MRRFEKIIGLVAVIGVLMHAGFLVRHNGIMLDAAFDRLALDFAGGIICHGGDDGQSETPLGPQSGKRAHCPVCVGAAASAVILPPMAVLPGRALAAAPCITAAWNNIAPQPSGKRPPSRAPPAAA